MKYVIQYANDLTKDIVETLEHYVIRHEDSREPGESDEDLAKKVLDNYWVFSRRNVSQGDYSIFEATQASLKLLWDKRLAKGKDYIQSSPTKASLIDTLTSLEKEVHMIWHSKAVEVQLMKKMKEHDTGTNMEYDKVTDDLNAEINNVINPVGSKISKMIMDLNYKFYMGSYDETRNEFTLTLSTSTETFGGATPSDIIDEIATRAIELFEKLKSDLHENNNDYRPDNYVKWLKTNMLDDEPEEAEDV